MLRSLARCILRMPSSLFKPSQYGFCGEFDCVSSPLRLVITCLPQQYHILIHQRIRTYPRRMTLRPSKGSSLAYSDGGREAWGAEAEGDV